MHVTMELSQNGGQIVKDLARENGMDVGAMDIHSKVILVLLEFPFVFLYSQFIDYLTNDVIVEKREIIA